VTDYNGTFTNTCDRLLIFVLLAYLIKFVLYVLHTCSVILPVIMV